MITLLLMLIHVSSDFTTVAKEVEQESRDLPLNQNLSLEASL